MKTILFLALLSFASSIVVVPTGGNMANLGTFESIYSRNFESSGSSSSSDTTERIHLAHPYTHEDNSKYRHNNKPHLAVVNDKVSKPSRKLLKSISRFFKRSSPPPPPAPEP